MILQLDDGSELQLQPHQIQDFTLLKDLSEMKFCKDEIMQPLALTGIDSNMVRDFFELHQKLTNKEHNYEWFFQKVQFSKNGYARDIISLNMFFGNETHNIALQKLFESLFQAMPDSVISHGFGLISEKDKIND